MGKVTKLTAASIKFGNLVCRCSTLGN